MPITHYPRSRPQPYSSIPMQLFPAKLPFKASLGKLVRAIKRVGHTHPRCLPPPLVIDIIPLSPVPSISHSSDSNSTMSGPSTPVTESDSVFGVSESTKPYVEPEAPDPFLVDSDEEQESATPTESRSVQEIQIPLVAPIPLSPHQIASPLLSPNLNKDDPPPPTDSDSDEEDAPELYLPALVIPTMFLPLPNTDPLTTLLNKYIHPPEKRPMRDLTGEWQRSDFHALVMSNSWRALARMARDRIVTADPEDLSLVLGLWYLRLSSLSRLRLYNQTTAECTNLFTVLNGVEPPTTRQWLFERVLPFELEVMNARLRYWAGDHMGYLDALYGLLRKCKMRCRRAKGDATIVAMWKERGARVCLIIASQLVEMKDFAAATKLLEPLCEQQEGDVTLVSPALHSAVGRIYLQCGNLAMAASRFELAAAGAPESMVEMNAALMAAAEGDWVQVNEILQGPALQQGPERFVAVNNRCVALLSQGKVQEGIAIMERALKESPESVVVAEPFLFNLSTLYELRSATAVENKRNLLIEVSRWSGDGLKTACLKMPT
ncbi:Tetratricopeptide repeat protein 15-like [Mycena indigotica]|uniref:Tetratricopeptide repeat protein 15-like n=1 Tax=Mycena indigotica TaxID=2126181 RepID=A0A8H6W9M0_9AGAR|nr:Tetratricopeptide repeat protein 15-like [Mycena indigotica]KAF7309842.1 Tetratricopeptide repeat protein 15-like [Mycena indigotica]